MVKPVFKQILFLFVLTLSFSTSLDLSATSLNHTEPEAYVPEDVVFMDDENRVCFIDLMAIDVTVSEIVLSNQNGRKMDAVDCLDLNVKEIIEIDLKEYPIGPYDIRFETIGGSFTKSIDVK